MPQSATLEQIKAYQEQLEKGKIKPADLPQCPQCKLDSMYFKEHAFRERKFLLIIKQVVKTAICPLLRYKCPGCGKTFTYYPPFAMPYKRYTVPAMMDFTKSYLEHDNLIYETAAMIDHERPAYMENEKMMAPSSIHRWIMALAGVERVCQKALSLILQKNPMSAICRELGRMTVSRQKYKSQNRKNQLISCRRLLHLEKVFRTFFDTSIFTKLAIREAFS